MIFRPGCGEFAKKGVDILGFDVLLLAPLMESGLDFLEVVPGKGVFKPLVGFGTDLTHPVQVRVALRFVAWCNCGCCLDAQENQGVSSQDVVELWTNFFDFFQRFGKSGFEVVKSPVFPAELIAQQR